MTAGRRFFVRGSPNRVPTPQELTKAIVIGSGTIIGKSPATRKGLALGVTVHIATVEGAPNTGKVKILDYTTTLLCQLEFDESDTISESLDKPVDRRVQTCLVVCYTDFFCLYSWVHSPPERREPCPSNMSCS
jgi:hypothetical protein